MVNFIILILVLFCNLGYASDAIRVEGIIDGDEPIAIINGELYKENSVCNGYTIVQINDNGLIVEKNAQQIHYWVEGGVKVDKTRRHYKSNETLNSYKPPEYYKAIAYWDAAYKSSLPRNAIKLHELAIKNAQWAMPKVNGIERSKLNEEVIESRDTISALEMKIQKAIAEKKLLFGMNKNDVLAVKKIRGKAEQRNTYKGVVDSWCYGYKCLDFKDDILVDF